LEEQGVNRIRSSFALALHAPGRLASVTSPRITNRRNDHFVVDGDWEPECAVDGVRRVWLKTWKFRFPESPQLRFRPGTVMFLGVGSLPSAREAGFATVRAAASRRYQSAALRVLRKGVATRNPLERMTTKLGCDRRCFIGYLRVTSSYCQFRAHSLCVDYEFFSRCGGRN